MPLFLTIKIYQKNTYVNNFNEEILSKYSKRYQIAPFLQIVIGKYVCNLII